MVRAERPSGRERTIDGMKKVRRAFGYVEATQKLDFGACRQALDFF